MARVKYMNSEERKRYKLDEYPNFHKSGSIVGMKKLYYGKNAFLVKSGSYIYHVPKYIYEQAH